MRTRRLLAAITAGLVLVLTAPAGAQTSPDDDPAQLAAQVEEAQGQLGSLRDDESVAVEAANRANDELRQVSGRAIAARREDDAAADELTAARSVIRARVLAAYKNGGTLGQVAFLFESATPAQLLERARYLREMSGRDRQRVDRVRAAQARSNQTGDLVADAVSREIAATGRRDSELARAHRAVTEQQRLLESLSARHRAAVEAAEARKRAEEEARFRAALGWTGPIPVVKVSNEQLQRVIDTALAQIGTPYVWGGEWPGGFDCSGLIRYAFGQVGVDLLHRADWQYLYGDHPSRSDLQPGDIVFFSKTGRAEDIHHDALYIGGGLMVEAPFTGALVRINTVDRPDYFGAARLF